MIKNKPIVVNFSNIEFFLNSSKLYCDISLYFIYLHLIEIT